MNIRRAAILPASLLLIGGLSLAGCSKAPSTGASTNSASSSTNGDTTYTIAVIAKSNSNPVFLAAKTGAIRFFSASYRLFRSDKLETECEDYGQAVIYRGSIPNSPDRCVLDKHHDMETGRVFPVCGNTWHMLKDTRFAPHFDFIGNFSRHYGIFAGCGGGLPFDEDAGSGSGGTACC